jgi:predicted nucleotidyltransferase
MNRKEEIKSMIKNVISSHLSGNYKAFLFGSQAGLSELKRADIDVGIDADHPLTSMEESLIWNDLQDLPTLYNFDVVDFKKADEKFKDIALKKTELL